MPAADKADKADKTAAPPVDDPSADTAPVANTSVDVDVPADEDDDWPTRYSWLDDEETDEATESDDALKSDDVMESVLAVGEPAKPTADTSKSAASKSAASKSAEAESPETKTPESLKSPTAEADAKAAGTKRATAKGPAAKAAKAADATQADTKADTKVDTKVDAATAQPESPAEAEDDQPSTDSETAGEDKPAAGQSASGTKMVAVVPGVPRYHEPDCVLIRFMPESDVQTKSIPEAKAANCTPCVACQPEE